jgi:pimeloyl-ACP methyl ester carboxylesterase
MKTSADVDDPQIGESRLYRILATDPRGYGQTERPRSVDVYDHAHSIGDLLKVVGEASAVIVGHDLE